jgi:anaerobic selenocysteine-containing dehydrogenase
MDAFWEKQLAGLKKVSDEEKAVITLDYLKRNGLWHGKEPKPKPNGKTPSHKLEIYSIFLAETYKKLKADGNPDAEVATPLAKWQQPNWMAKKAKLGGDEFVPVTGFVNINSFTGGQTKDNRLLGNVGDAINWDAVFINASKGKSMGIKDGDMVIISNSDIKGMEQPARVKLSEIVHPDAMFTYYGVGNGAFGQLNKMFLHTPKTGFNPNHSAPFHFSPLVGGHAGQDYIVKIRRA